MKLPSCRRRCADLHRRALWCGLALLGSWSTGCIFDAAGPTVLVGRALELSSTSVTLETSGSEKTAAVDPELRASSQDSPWVMAFDAEMPRDVYLQQLAVQIDRSTLILTSLTNLKTAYDAFAKKHQVGAGGKVDGLSRDQATAMANDLFEVLQPNTEVFNACYFGQALRGEINVAGWPAPGAQESAVFRVQVDDDGDFIVDRESGATRLPLIWSTRSERGLDSTVLRSTADYLASALKWADARALKAFIDASLVKCVNGLELLQKLHTQLLAAQRAVKNWAIDVVLLNPSDTAIALLPTATVDGELELHVGTQSGEEFAKQRGPLIIEAHSAKSVQLVGGPWKGGWNDRKLRLRYVIVADDDEVVAAEIRHVELDIPAIETDAPTAGAAAVR